MTTKLYEIISATQLMHEPWHFVIKVADFNPNVPICGQVYSFIDEDNKKLELIPWEIILMARLLLLTSMLWLDRIGS